MDQDGPLLWQKRRKREAGWNLPLRTCSAQPAAHFTSSNCIQLCNRIVLPLHFRPQLVDLRSVGRRYFARYGTTDKSKYPRDFVNIFHMSRERISGAKRRARCRASLGLQIDLRYGNLLYYDMRLPSTDSKAVDTSCVDTATAYFFTFRSKDSFPYPEGNHTAIKNLNSTPGEQVTKLVSALFMSIAPCREYGKYPSLNTHMRRSQTEHSPRPFVTMTEANMPQKNEKKELEQLFVQNLEGHSRLVKPVHKGHSHRRSGGQNAPVLRLQVIDGQAEAALAKHLCDKIRIWRGGCGVGGFSLLRDRPLRLEGWNDRGRSVWYPARERKLRTPLLYFVLAIGQQLGGGVGNVEGRDKKRRDGRFTPDRRLWIRTGTREQKRGHPTLPRAWCFLLSP